MKKRKIFTVILIFSIVMATLAGCDKADKVSDTTKKPVIKIGSDNYPPYNFLNEDGIPTGIDVELATEAFRRHRKSTDGNESRAYFCMYESKKTGKISW